MKITVLDGYGMNPGDMSWSPLEQLGQFTVYDRTAPSEILSRAAGSEALLSVGQPNPTLIASLLERTTVR